MTNFCDSHRNSAAAAPFVLAVLIWVLVLLR